MHKIIFTLLLLLLGNTLQAKSFDNLAELENYALKNNLSLRSQWEIVFASQQQSGVLGSFEDLKLGVRVNGIPAQKSGDLGNDQNRYFISQTLPFFGKLSDLETLGDLDSKIKLADFEILYNQKQLEVRSLYYLGYLFQEEINITQSNISLLERLLNVADIAYQSGKGNQANLLRLRIEKIKLLEKKLSFETQQKIIKHQLKTLIHLNPSQNLEIQFKIESKPSDTTASLSELNHQLLQNPVLKKAKWLFEKSKTEKDFQWKTYFPNLSVQLESWDNNIGPDQNAIQLMINVPWFNRRNDAAFKQKEYLLNASRINYEDIQTLQRLNLLSLIDQIKNSEQLYQLYNSQIVPFAKQSIEAVTQAYETGNATFTDLIDTQRMLLESQLKEVNHLTQYFILQARLNSLFEQERKS